MKNLQIAPLSKILSLKRQGGSHTKIHPNFRTSSFSPAAMYIFYLKVYEEANEKIFNFYSPLTNVRLSSVRT